MTVNIELPGGGVDTVLSTANSFSLDPNPNIENLTLLGTAVTGIGNDLANKITGDGASNVLQGLDGNDTLIGNDGSDNLNGGTGADSMAGGAGNDSYTVDDVGDKIVENGPSTDHELVNSFITCTLGANLEFLQLLGNANIDGTGNNLNNDLLGNGERLGRGRHH